jgi:hypothetical protein
MFLGTGLAFLKLLLSPISYVNQQKMRVSVNPMELLSSKIMIIPFVLFSPPTFPTSQKNH